MSRSRVLLCLIALRYVPQPCLGIIGDSRPTSGVGRQQRVLSPPPPPIGPTRNANIPTPRFPSRRDCLLSTFAATPLLLRTKYAPPVATTTNANSSPIILGVNVEPLPSIEATLDVISKSCNRRYLHAVVASNYNFLYRGLDNPADAAHPSIRSNEPYDLLNPATYGSGEAAEHFARLDRRMAAADSPVRPSNGHLAVTCPEAAAEWGTAASVWPLDGESDGGVSFAWFVDGGAFWPRVEGASNDLVVDGRDCGEIDLDDALVGDRWEVLFRAERFLTVPVAMESDLREGLMRSFVI